MCSLNSTYLTYRDSEPPVHSGAHEQTAAGVAPTITTAAVIAPVSAGVKPKRTREVSPVALLPIPPDTGHRRRIQVRSRARMKITHANGVNVAEPASKVKPVNEHMKWVES